MLPAVDLDHEATGRAGEVDDVRTERHLPAEAGAQGLATEGGPEAALGLGQVGAEVAGLIGEVCHARGAPLLSSPLTQPAPSQGGGTRRWAVEGINRDITLSCPARPACAWGAFFAEPPTLPKISGVVPSAAEILWTVAAAGW